MAFVAFLLLVRIVEQASRHNHFRAIGGVVCSVWFRLFRKNMGKQKALYTGVDGRRPNQNKLNKQQCCVVGEGRTYSEVVIYNSISVLYLSSLLLLLLLLLQSISHFPQVAQTTLYPPST